MQEVVRIKEHHEQSQQQVKQVRLIRKLHILQRFQIVSITLQCIQNTLKTITLNPKLLSLEFTRQLLTLKTVLRTHRTVTPSVRQLQIVQFYRIVA